MIPANDAVPRRAGGRARVRGLKQRHRAWVFGLAMVSPALAIYLVFVIYPLIRGAIVSLYQWDGLTPTMTWMGLRNYTDALDDPIFRLALRNTFQYAIGVTIAKNVLGLGLALLLNNKLRLRAFFRTAAFLPVMFSFVVCGVLWSWIFNPLFGLADHALALVGIHSPPGWLSDPSIALWSVMWVDVWKWTGFHMVLFLAALQAVPQDLYDAAAIDGARAWSRLWHVTIPQIPPSCAWKWSARPVTSRRSRRSSRRYAKPASAGPSPWAACPGRTSTSGPATRSPWSPPPRPGPMAASC